MRLLLDDPSNGIVNLRADPKNEGDLKEYLPGYTVPHNGVRRKQAIQVDFSNAPRPKWKAENYVTEVRGQRLFAVVHVPPNVGGIVTFELRGVTNHPGTATNLVEPGQDRDGYVPKPDFDLLDPASMVHTDRVTVPVNVAKHEARVELFCWDFGGNCQVVATALLTDRPNEEVMTMDVPDFEPGARFPEALPKAWLRQVGELPFEDDDQSTNRIPGEKRGDGLRNHEEYRGFFIRGRHWRLNDKETDGPGEPGQKGGPGVKDLFLADFSRVYLFINFGSGLESDHAQHVPALRLKENRFLLAHGLAIHLIYPWEMATAGSEVLDKLTWLLGGAVNFNGANDQCAVVLDNMKLSDEQHDLTTGETPNPGVVNIAGRREVFSRPIAVDVQKIIDHLESLGRRWQYAEYVHSTVAHELGHRLTLRHTSVLLSQAKDNKPQDPPAGGARAEFFWVERFFDKKGKEDTQKSILKWWGPAEFVEARGKPHPRPLEAVLTGDATVKDIDLRALTSKSSMLLREGKTEEAWLHEYELPRPVDRPPHAISLLTHLHYQMDPRPELRDMPAKLSPEDMLKLDVRSKGTIE